MLFEDKPQPSFQVFEVSHTDGFSDQAGHAVAPFVVQAFDQVGFAAALGTGSMLRGSEPFGVSLVEIGVDQLAAITYGQGKPQTLQALNAAVANVKADDLTTQTRNAKPQILVAPLEAIADHQFVNLQRGTPGRGQQRVGESQARFSRLFLSSARIVSRLTPKVRAMARCDSLSPNALTIRASFSADRARRWGVADHALRHTLQYKRRLPERVKPERITASPQPQ